MIETMVCIILAPFALVGAVFTVCFAIGCVKALFTKKN